jgi:hypothetical protein
MVSWELPCYWLDSWLSGSATIGRPGSMFTSIRGDFRYWHKCEVQRYPLFGRYQGKPNVARTSRFVDSEVIRGMPLQEVAGDGREAWRAVSGALRGCCEQHFVPAHNPRALMSYCVRNLYVTIRATMLAKISSAGRDFRIIGPVEWRAADPG